MGTKGALYRWLTAMVVFGSIFLFSPLASAAVSHFVAEGPDGKYYEYPYEELLESYVLQVVTGQGKIYADYAGKQTRAMLDSINGYVDYVDVLEAYAVAVINGNPFDMNAYASSEKAKPAVMPETVWIVSLGENQLIYTAKHLIPENTLLRLINEATTKEDMKKAVLDPAGGLNLNLVEYNQLNTYGKDLVIAGLLAERPSTGYGDLEAVTTTFYVETQKAKTLLAETVATLNSSANKTVLVATIVEKAAILDICLEGYQSLKDTEKSKVAEILFPKLPFSSPGAVKHAFESAVTAAAHAYISIFYSKYNLTLEEMVSIQMTKSPQTDLYGGGWKNALAEDVEYYLNPVNFVDPNAGGETTEMAKITASVLNVRERPSTDSPIVTKVYSGEMYLIEDARDGEPGTSAETQETWYQITATNVTGWIYSAHVEIAAVSLKSSMFQFLVLSGSAGVSADDLGKLLAGRGILSGTEASFLAGSLEYNINEIFLAALALHETGNGRSTLANGIDFEDRDNLFPDQETVKVYNMFGIGAYDSNPNYLGAQYAYNKRWFTPELAILGGAQFTSVSYINHPTYQQNTLYKMRWNPGSPGRHQYATDIGWASKQVGRIKNLYDQCINYVLVFDIPEYKK